MRHYKCQCGNVLFFDNSLCVQCGLEVGYDMASDAMLALGPDSSFRRCDNGLRHAVCNWLVPADGTLCPACKLNRTIPALPDHLHTWHKIEIAKRRVLYTLGRLGLFPPSRTDDPENGLVFDFLEPAPGGSVLTGHEHGVITLNIREAEDSEREKQRENFGEKYRTLIGHFRHELAHYFWDRFFLGKPDGDPALLGLREIFGDDRADYNAALAEHYAQVSQQYDAEKFISFYAATHPWEDWAETWAHYLHIMDGTETAENFGLCAAAVPIPFTPFPKQAATLPAGLTWRGEQKEFFSLLEAWAKLAPALNEIVASLGHEPFYPFVFSIDIVRKFFFVHYMIQTGAPLSGAAKSP